MSVDEIQIKPKEIDFNKLVEEELAKENENFSSNQTEVPKKPKFKYEKKTEKYIDKYKVSKPSETKQYKYYTDNFEKKRSDSASNKRGKSKEKSQTIITPQKKVGKIEKNEEKINLSNKRETQIKRRNVNISQKIEDNITPTTNDEIEEDNISFDNDDLQIVITKKPISSLTSIGKNTNVSCNKTKKDFLSQNNTIPSIFKLPKQIKDDLNFEFKLPNTSNNNENLNNNDKKESIDKDRLNEIEPNVEEPIYNISNRNNSTTVGKVNTNIINEEEHEYEHDNNDEEEIENNSNKNKENINDIEENIEEIDCYVNEKEKDFLNEPLVEVKKSIEKIPPKEIEYSFSNSNYMQQTKKNISVPQINNVNISNSNGNNIMSEKENNAKSEYIEKLAELNKDIQVVKLEKQRVLEMKAEYERLTKKLKLDINEYAQTKEQEKYEFERYKEEELRKIDREKKAQFKNVKNIQLSSQLKKEKEENEYLKSEVLKLKEELKTKEQRNKLVMDRIRRQYEESLKKIDDLQKDIEILEDKLKNCNQSSTKNVNKVKPPLCANLTSEKKKLNSNRNKTRSISRDKVPVITTTPIHNNANSNISYTGLTPPTEDKFNLNQYNDYTLTSHRRSNSLSNNNNTTLPSNNIIPNSYSNNNISNAITHKNSNSNLDDDDPSQYEMVFLPLYHNNNIVKLAGQEVTQDGKIIKVYENGKKEVIFPSGLRKEIFADGYQVTYFQNKDIKQLYPDQKEVYYFGLNETVQTKFPDGLQVFKFANGQIEKHYPDKSRVIKYNDGIVRTIFPDKYEEIFYPDGSLQKIEPNGTITIDYENGMKETKYPDGTEMKEYPDGRICKINTNGTKETYYK